MALSEDESVRIAVRALGDMKNSGVSPLFQPTPALSMTSGTSSPSLPSPSLEPDNISEGRIDRRQSEDVDFVSRMSTFPIVNSALRVYEQGKASSRVVKYGAEMMESSVKSISRPVIDRLPVGQLDEFACRQLDRLENYTRRNASQDREHDRERGRSTQIEYDRNVGRSADYWETRDVSMARESSRSRHTDHDRWQDAGPSSSNSMQMDSRTSTPQSQFFSQSSHNHDPASLQLPPPQQQQPDRSSSSSTSTQPENQQVAQRSRWQAVLLEAGGIGAAVSEESMRRLRYCLQWLQYATSHIDAQILVLRNFITSLQPSSSSPHPALLVSQQHLRTLNAAKRDVVDTVRQVVDVVSRYAGGGLPEPARARVRTFILRLPRRWAEAAGVDGTDGRPGGGASRVDMRRANGSAAPYSYGPGEAGPSPRSRPPSRATSPGQSRAHSRQTSGNGFGSGTGGVPTTADAASDAAQRILTLATESLDMLRGVTTVVSESLDRADAWVERLRVVGLQRQQNGDNGNGIASDADGMLDLREPNSRIPSTESLSSLYAPRQHYGNTPSSPMSPFPSLSPLAGSAATSGHTTPSYTMSRNSSSSALSMGPPSSLSSYYSANLMDAGGAAASLNELSISSHAHGSATSSRLATPKSVLAGLPPEGDGGGGTYLPGVGSFMTRGEKRSAEGEDPKVLAATALAGLAGSAKRVKQDRGRDDSMEVEN
ncbi:hypothetical protein IEO21_01041 [Rhodonia placenta]|uniref:Opi1-domain-containing protein n=1 Tax=Rhodonia placenta TaxID=104341 RepID=A0A8H7PA55_9APHY|nr:hypothetical protein IEO21_01041 [Postia placenta]